MEKFFKIAEDGFLIRGSGKVVPSGYRTDWDSLEKKKDGTEFTYYKEDDTADIEREEKENINNDILNKIIKAKKYLVETDHKFCTDYTLKEDETLEDIAEIKTTRAECRDFIRTNK